MWVQESIRLLVEQKWSHWLIGIALSKNKQRVMDVNSNINIRLKEHV